MHRNAMGKFFGTLRDAVKPMEAAAPPEAIAASRAAADEQLAKLTVAEQTEITDALATIMAMAGDPDVTINVIERLALIQSHVLMASALAMGVPPSVIAQRLFSTVREAEMHAMLSNLFGGDSNAVIIAL